VAALRELLDLYAEARPLIDAQAPALAERVRDLSERVDLAYVVPHLDEMLSRSRHGLGRIQHIVEGLREFARLDTSDLGEVDLNAGVQSATDIIRGRATAKGVRLDLDLAPLGTVSCYPAKINQVVMHLVTNAIDACEADGVVTVRTTQDDGVVLIEVTDTGCGIDPAIQQRIFDPFFTTKPPGHGTGLGLSISHGMVGDHGGTITVRSSPGRGSTFAVRLPTARR